MRDRRLACLIVVAVALCIGASTGPVAAAEDVTASELRTLAAQAERDPEAQRQLAEVRRVDGRPVDVAAALEGADEEERRSRLRALAEGTDAPPVAGAREDAERILQGRRYKPAEAPRPLRGVLRRIGGWLRPIGDLLGKIHIPAWAQGVLAVAALAVAVAVATRLVTRRKAAAVASEGAGEFRRRRGDDPAALERQADDAERGGDYDLAVRLRFRAGLLRLDAARVVELRPSLTTGELRRRLGSEALHDLATTFEAVAYAGEPADADDVAAARRDWPRVLQEVRR